jgi:riboflavin synthase
VHVERAMRVGDRIDGHFVQGNVDGTAILKKTTVLPGETRLTIEPPAGLGKLIVPKGSVCIDGVSLTVAALHPNTFEVALIPTTLQRTTLGDRLPGWPFNFEADVLSKTIISWLERMDTRQIVGGMQSALGNR